MSLCFNVWLHRSTSCGLFWKMFYILVWFLSLLHPPSPQREVVSSTRLAAIPPAFSIRTLPAQATEYTFAFIQVPQDVSARASTRAGRQRYVSQLKASKLTWRYQLLQSHFLPAFESWLSWQDIKTVWVSLIARGDKSVTDRQGRVFIPSKC